MQALRLNADDNCRLCVLTCHMCERKIDMEGSKEGFLAQPPFNMIL